MPCGATISLKTLLYSRILYESLIESKQIETRLIGGFWVDINGIWVDLTNELRNQIEMIAVPIPTTGYLELVLLCVIDFNWL